MPIPELDARTGNLPPGVHDAAQKAKYGGELFPANGPADPAGKAFFDFFQVDREGQRKGIVAIDPGAL